MTRRIFICSGGHIFATQGSTPDHCESTMTLKKQWPQKEDKVYVCKAEEVYEIHTTRIK